jgi:hypothetical protein
MASRSPLKIMTPAPAAPTNAAPRATNAVAGVAPGPDADIRPAKGLVRLPSGWAWAGWAALALALAAAGYLAWRKWRRRKTPVAAVPEVPPHARARQRLQAALGLISHPEPFCVAVSQALRIYLEERFGLNAPERTTQEFLAELQTSHVLDLTHKTLLGDFLFRCDLVKFAKYEPTEVELLELHAAALRLVDDTEPRPLAAAGTVPAPTPGTIDPATPGDAPAPPAAMVPG